MKQFEQLKRISNNYRAAVDNLAEDYELAGRQDYRYNDEIRAQRVRERNVDYNARIDATAARAVEDAASVIDELRAVLKTYITSSDDTGTLAAMQALVISGVTLTDAELAAFSEKGGFVTLKLLEKYSGGRFKAPTVDGLEENLKELETFFKDLSAYRGSLAPINPVRPWGQSPTVGSKIQQGMIEHFSEKLDAMVARWSTLERSVKV